MKTVYWDMSELSPNSGVFGISSSEVNVVSAGTTLNVMSARERERMPQYGEIEERYGIFFFFSDRDEPELPFFAVPHLERWSWYPCQSCCPKTGKERRSDDGCHGGPDEGAGPAGH